MATRTALDGHPDRTTVHRPACRGLLLLKRFEFSDVFWVVLVGSDGRRWTAAHISSWDASRIDICPVCRRSTSRLEATDLLRGCQDDEDERCLRQLCRQLMAPVKGPVTRWYLLKLIVTLLELPTAEYDGQAHGQQLRRSILFPRMYLTHSGDSSRSELVLGGGVESHVKLPLFTIEDVKQNLSLTQTRDFASPYIENVQRTTGTNPGEELHSLVVLVRWKVPSTPHPWY